MTARVFVISGDELIPVTREDLPLVTDPDGATVLVSQTRGEHIAIMLFDERYRVAYCETCGWSRWKWDGTRFRCNHKKAAAPLRELLTVSAAEQPD